MLEIVPSDELKQGADAAWRAVEDGQVAASCSLWWTDAPSYQGERLGLVGHFNAANEAAAIALLDCAARQLTERGCTLAVGPMDGSTWRRYRLVIERGNEPPFLLEPDNPDEWPAWFIQAQFEVMATYTSAVADELQLSDDRAERAWARLQGEGFSIRPLNAKAFDKELEVLYGISIASFQPNFLYKPISFAEFTELYRPVQAIVRPELVLIAERNQDPAAFLFAIPDRLPERFIIKTLAAHPRYAGRGLGTILILEANRAAAQLGFKRAIHALMHEENQSTRISARQARVFRRYALYSRRLKEPA